MKLEILGQIFRKSQISNLIKIRPVGADLFHADRQTDMELIVTFRKCSNAPKTRNNPNL